MQRMSFKKQISTRNRNVKKIIEFSKLGMS